MAYLAWQNEFSVGIPSIDAQHQNLVRMLNDLFQASQSAQNQEAVGQVLRELVKYSVAHFATEERLMRDHAFPGYGEHRNIHEKMKAKVSSLVQDYQAGKAQIGQEVTQFLKDWLTKHIQQTDMKYSQFLVQKGVK